MSAPANVRFRLAWRAAGYACFSLGAIGAVLPVLPTTGPWILAVWCLWKGDDPLAHRLLDHPRFGRALRDWFQHGLIGRRGKLGASAGMALAAVFTAAVGLRGAPLALLIAGLAMVCCWIWSRPEKRAA